MSEIMPFEEIEKKYHGEWVLMDCLEFDENNEICAARVRLHGTDKKEVYRQGKELHISYGAAKFMGPVVPPGMGVITRLLM